MRSTGGRETCLICARRAILLLGTIGTDEWNQAEQLRAMLTRGGYSSRILAAVQASLAAIGPSPPPPPHGLPLTSLY